MDRDEKRTQKRRNIMKKTLKRFGASLTAAALLLALAACSPAEQTQTPSPDGDDGKLDFPKQDVTIIVPYAAGGNTDLFARAMSTKMSELMGVNVIIQNVEGGGGATGTAQAVTGKADGYTLALPANSAYVLNSQVNDVGYTVESTTPICIISEASFAFAVAADSPYMTLQDLLDADASEPGGITYCTPGANSAGHLMISAVGKENNLENWNHSPKASAPGAIAELIGGHIDAYCSNLSVFKSPLENGDIRLLAVTGDERDEKYPDVPTFKELGYDYPVSVYFCLVGPGQMDPAVVEYLSDIVRQTLEDSGVQDAFSKLDQPISFVGAEDFATRVTEDYELYHNLMKDMGVIS